MLTNAIVSLFQNQFTSPPLPLPSPTKKNTVGKKRHQIRQILEKAGNPWETKNCFELVWWRVVTCNCLRPRDTDRQVEAMKRWSGRGSFHSAPDAPCHCLPPDRSLVALTTVQYRCLQGSFRMKQIYSIPVARKPN